MITGVNITEKNRKPQKIYLGDLLEVIKPHTKVKFVNNITEQEIDQAPFDTEVLEIDFGLDKTPQSNYELYIKFLLEVE